MAALLCLQVRGGIVQLCDFAVDAGEWDADGGLGAFEAMVRGAVPDLGEGASAVATTTASDSAGAAPQERQYRIRLPAPIHAHLGGAASAGGSGVGGDNIAAVDRGWMFRLVSATLAEDVDAGTGTGAGTEQALMGALFDAADGATPFLVFPMDHF